MVRNERLKSRKLIEQLFKKGKSFSAFPFRIVYILEEKIPDTNNASPIQAGFSVSSRNFKRAVDRNRIKRLMREAYRLQKNDLQAQLRSANKTMTVFFLYTGNEVSDYEQVFSKMAKALKQLQKIANEITTSNM